MKRKGEIFSVDKNNPLPEILNCTRSLVCAVTGAEERRRSVMENLSNVDSFIIESFRWPPGSICVKEVSGGLSPSSGDKSIMSLLKWWPFAIWSPNLGESPPFSPIWSDSDPEDPGSRPGRLRQDRQDLSPRATHNSTSLSPLSLYSQNTSSSIILVTVFCIPPKSTLQCLSGCHCSVLFSTSRLALFTADSLLYGWCRADPPPKTELWWALQTRSPGPVHQPRPLPGDQPVSSLGSERHNTHSEHLSSPGHWHHTLTSPAQSGQRRV